MNLTRHSSNSCQRENLIEHLFLAELLKHVWLKTDGSLEVSKPQVDEGGYDVVLEWKGIIRHVQLKSSHRNAKRVYVDVSLRLTEKPSGCVIWVFFDENTLELGPYRWLGGDPGDRLNSLVDFKVSKHTKGDAQGNKSERPGSRRVPKSKFQVLKSVGEVLARLFGEIAATV